MTIGIDASRANKDFKTGTEWYSYYIIEELKKITPVNTQVILYTNEKLKGGLEKMPNEKWQEKDLKWPPKYLWTQIRLWWELFINPPDYFFVPAHTIPFLPLRKKTKVLVTVHDVGFKRSPELYKKIQVLYHDSTMRRIKQRADVIITDSEFSKNEIVELYNINSERIKVIYLGYDKEKFRKIDDVDKLVLDKYKITRPYILYIGRIEKKKNVANMIHSLALVKDKHPDLRLVLAGGSGFDFEAVKQIITDLKLENEIIIPGYIDETDLPQVIASAEVFLFPTLYEGFGLPILQAMACETPVVTSDMDPHREVAGGATLLTDPKDAQAIADSINSILENDSLRQKLVQKGIARVKDFSWTKTAESILAIMK